MENNLELAVLEKIRQLPESRSSQMEFRWPRLLLARNRSFRLPEKSDPANLRKERQANYRTGHVRLPSLQHWREVPVQPAGPLQRRRPPESCSEHQISARNANAKQLANPQPLPECLSVPLVTRIKILLENIEQGLLLRPGLLLDHQETGKEEKK